MLLSWFKFFVNNEFVLEKTKSSDNKTEKANLGEKEIFENAKSRFMLIIMLILCKIITFFSIVYLVTILLSGNSHSQEQADLTGFSRGSLIFIHLLIGLSHMS